MKIKKINFVDKITILLTLLAILLAAFAILVANGNISIGESGFFFHF